MENIKDLKIYADLVNSFCTLQMCRISKNLEKSFKNWIDFDQRLKEFLIHKTSNKLNQDLTSNNRCHVIQELIGLANSCCVAPETFRDDYR